ncbi:histidine phosphatase family protein [Tumebacillus permanentifrigoris]|uniref:Alpha-ribazole phosphatase/probable phosphoglycerate mutase n=1 Tax=Tumebacillus permanentifrigoris TaxID=378543 RepID=A0A316DXI0_9BACL|nr:histidine phosphatase family protein [Tumebacillus permanentifrigoris]PWK14821.1 alpha-ribazole phosphatase/probable phosphoglycerate mutase [Tumebacillus permanentifrigoris]
MELILVRHGETSGNALRQYIGRTDLPLNERGSQQIIELRNRLAPLLTKVTRLSHSPLLRTQQTAELLIPDFDQHSADPRLLELNFGDWEAQTYAELEATAREQLWRWYDDPWTVAPPNGETLQDLDIRLSAWHERIACDASADETLLVVSHGGPIRWWYAKYVLQDPARFHHLHLPPGGFAHVRRTTDGWTLVEGEITAT